MLEYRLGHIRIYDILLRNYVKVGQNNIPNLTPSDLVIKTFWGFKSLWSTLCECMYCTAIAIWMNHYIHKQKGLCFSCWPMREAWEQAVNYTSTSNYTYFHNLSFFKVSTLLHKTTLKITLPNTKIYHHFNSIHNRVYAGEITFDFCRIFPSNVPLSQ